MFDCYFSFVSKVVLLIYLDDCFSSRLAGIIFVDMEATQLDRPVSKTLLVIDLPKLLGWFLYQFDFGCPS